MAHAPHKMHPCHGCAITRMYYGHRVVIGMYNCALDGARARVRVRSQSHARKTQGSIERRSAGVFTPAIALLLPSAHLSAVFLVKTRTARCDSLGASRATSTVLVLPADLGESDAALAARARAH